MKVAYAASAWSLLFALPHVYWATGGTAGLDGEVMRGTLAVVNYGAIVLSIIAAALALALVRPWGAALPRRVLIISAWAACALLSVRGAAGLLQDAAVALGGSGADVPTLVLVFEPLFLVGGVLFGLAAGAAGGEPAGAAQRG